MFIEWSWVAGFIIGAAIGSFLNVVIYRLPRSLSLGKPKHSFCPKCKHRLTGPDLIPLLSFLMTRGKCRHCKEKVSPRYFLVELVNGAIWAGLWYQHLVIGWDPLKALFYALAASALVAAIFIDYLHYIIPDQINAALLFIGIGFNVWLLADQRPEGWTWGMPSAVAGALVGVLALWLIAFLGRIVFRKDAMGHGDIKMARGIGAVLFPVAAGLSFAIAVVLGAVFGVLQVLFLKGEGDGSVDSPDRAASHEASEVSAKSEEDVVPAQLDEGDDYPPESIGSLLKSGLGYLLCIDVIGLFAPKLYMSWFGEDPFEPIDEADDFEVERTMIPFGPYLALGAILAAVFQEPLLGWVRAYMDWATRGAA